MLNSYIPYDGPDIVDEHDRRELQVLQVYRPEVRRHAKVSHDILFPTYQRYTATLDSLEIPLVLLVLAEQRSP